MSIEQFNPVVINLIRICIQNAIDTMEDMYGDFPTETGPEDYKESIVDNALSALQVELDPEWGDIRIPMSLQNAVREIVENNIKIKYVLE